MIFSQKKRSAHQQRVNQFPPMFRATAHDHAVRLQYFDQCNLLSSQALLLHSGSSLTVVQQRYQALALLCWDSKSREKLTSQARTTAPFRLVTFSFSWPLGSPAACGPSHWSTHTVHKLCTQHAKAHQGCLL